jgi:transposase
MTKYSTEERLAAIQAVEGGKSIKGVAKDYQMNKDVLERNVRQYREHGKEGLTKHVNTWTVEQKYHVLEYMHENRLSCLETGIQFGLRGSSTVWQWEQKYLEKGIMGLENKKKGRKPRTPKPKLPKTRLEELEEENLNLRIENEYLKKLNALVAEREKRERGNE